MTIFRILSILLGGFCLGFAFVANRLAPKQPALAGKLARHRLGGALLGFLALCWCAWEGAAMLPPAYATPVWLLVPVTLAACWFFLDFHFARALGGVLVLTANHLIQHAFAYYCGCRGIYCVAALAWGLWGMTLVGWPWLLRDLLQCLPRHPKGQMALWTACILCALAFFILPFCGRH